MSNKQEVLIDKDGGRYVIGTDIVKGKEVPCNMPIVQKCSKCGFEWPDVLNCDEVNALKAGNGCPECRYY